jgi:hypothetical protein
LPFCNDALLKLDKDLREREKDAKNQIKTVASLLATGKGYSFVS